MIPVLAFSQKQNDLRYFISKDSLVGVKNQKGEIIIPAQFINLTGMRNGEPLKLENDAIFFDSSLANRDEVEKNSWGVVFDKKGKMLYQPYSYDNGADYFSEGVRRFVKKGKVGFVDRNAKIIIDAKHDFVSSFNYGYAVFCDGCDWEKTEDEHPQIIGGTWGVINFKGEIMQPLTNHSEKDIKVNGKYYAYPFQYNEKEKNILQFFEKYNTILSAIHYVNVYNEMSEKEKKLLFEIVERPKESFPYYQINTFDNEKANLGSFGDLTFFMSEDGKNVYAINYEKEMIPFKKWLKEEIKQAEKYQKEHPDNLNKFKNNLN